MKYENQWETKGLLRTFSGKMTGEYILKMNLSLHGDPRFDDLRYIINDLSNISEFDISDMDIETIAAIDNAGALSNSNIKIAVVTTNQALTIWVKRYLTAMEDSTFQCQLFEDVSAARQWTK
jgi:hypothetical protein